MRLFSRKMTVSVRTMRADDIEEVRSVGQSAWSDLYSKEFRQNFQVPKRSRKNIEFYMDKEPEGCIVAEVDGRVVGDIFCHVWGKVGWFGPVEVMPNFQNSGIGKQLISVALSYLQSKGCEIIGLETMPETLKNVVLYSNLGFAPDRVTYLMEKPLTGRDRNVSDLQTTGKVLNYGELGAEKALSSVRLLSELSLHGLDYSNEVYYSMKHGTGETLFLLRDESVVGFSLVYTYSTSDGSTNASIRLLVASPSAGSGDINNLMSASEGVALEEDRDRMNIRFYTGNYRTFDILRKRGYALKGTNIRMLHRGNIPANNEVVEIDSWAG